MLVSVRIRILTKFNNFTSRCSKQPPPLHQLRWAALLHPHPCLTPPHLPLATMSSRHSPSLPASRHRLSPQLRWEALLRPPPTPHATPLLCWTALLWSSRTELSENLNSKCIMVAYLQESKLSQLVQIPTSLTTVLSDVTAQTDAVVRAL